ncbi:MAG TPA: SulP family inorganic anion transporter, partial [Acidimicrobiales bacterium]|nr:SulP family inorganic anion transporter [Acidimicrobiales bacterium]
LGVARPEGENTLAVAIAATGRAFQEGNGWSIVLVAVAAAIMVFGPRLHRSLPASLFAVAAATVIAEIGDLGVARIGALPSSFPSPQVPGLSLHAVSELFGAAVAVAALVAIESLLSARVADGMADVRRHDPDRELLGQGLASLVSPLFGGMPATGAIARTAVNVRAGARTRVASIVHAVLLFAVVLGASGIVSRIPLAALAGVLIVTGVRMVERHNVLAVVRATRSDALVFALTTAATIAFDLIVAIEIGVAVAAVLALRSIAIATVATPTPVPGTVEIDDEAEHKLLSENIIAYRLDGALFFGAAQRFLTELTNVTDARVVILRMPDLLTLDATGAQALGEIVAELEDRGITVLLKGVRPAHHRVLHAVGALERLANERHIFQDLETAIRHAHRHAARHPHRSSMAGDLP